MSETDQLIRELRAANYVVTRRRRSNHWCIQRTEGGAKVFLPSTPSDRRGIRNSLMELKRIGFRRKKHE